MKKSFFTSLLLVAAAGLGSANVLPNITTPALPDSIPTADPIQLISELTPQCQASLFSIVANPEFFQCVPVASLLPLLTDPTLLPSILKDPVANAQKLLPVVEAVCADPKCSDKGVTAAKKAVQDGCSDSKDAGNPIIKLVSAVLEFYSPVRDIICFTDNKKNLCIVDTFKAVFSLPSPPQKLLGGIIDKLLFAEPRFICTPCDKAIVGTVVTFLKKDPAAIPLLESAFHIGEEELFIAQAYFAIKCGFQFLDGKPVDPSKIDPGNFVYQEGYTSGANQNEMNLIMLGSLLASSFVLQ